MDFEGDKLKEHISGVSERYVGVLPTFLHHRAAVKFSVSQVSSLWSRKQRVSTEQERVSADISVMPLLGSILRRF